MNTNPTSSSTSRMQEDLSKPMSAYFLDIRVCLCFSVIFLLMALSPLAAQTSWKGTISTSWSTSANWTNGLPSSTKDAIIGDANFTGNYQPAISIAASCKSLTIGSATKVSNLTVDKQLTIEGSVTIGVNGTLTHSSSTITLKGNWSNSGSYSSSQNGSISFVLAGVSQQITGPTSFKKLTINTGSSTILNDNITISKSLTVNGSLDPGNYLVTLPNGGSAFTVNSDGVIKVNTATLAGNYSSSPSLNQGSIVDYSSSTVNQTIDVNSYSTLRISGALVKSLGGNITLQSSSSTTGNLEILSATLDISTKSLNRGTSVLGGSVTIANGAFMRIAGTNTYPANFATSNLATTSTVEYYGTNQAISNQPYGNLTLSSSSGSATKTMPATPMVVANDFTSSKGTGTSVTFTAAANISINGNLTIGSSTTFNGGSFVHTISGNWTNNGTFTGSTSTIVMAGASKIIGGSTSVNFNNLTIAGLGVTSSSANITVSGNLGTSGPGTFAHTSTSGTLTMTGASASVTGSDITVNNLTLSGNVNATSSLTINGNLVVNGSLNATAGTINMNGTAKTISGSGSITFYSVQFSKTTSAAIGFAVRSDFSSSGSGAFTATAGTVSFIGTSNFSGTHNLYNVTLNGTDLQLGANAVMGIAGSFTFTSGIFDITTSVPNTVNFNATGNQTIPAATFNSLMMTGGGTKTAGGPIQVNGTINIAAGVGFSASSYTHTINGDWVNNGTFFPLTSTIKFGGSSDASITGASLFNILTISKSSPSAIVSLNSNITVPILNMTSGGLNTGSNSITITSTRTGNGVIMGTIVRTHSFLPLTDYAFESAYNVINFASITGSVTSISVTVKKASIDDFLPLDGSINRDYSIVVTTTGSYVAKLRLHYEDIELNGNNESSMTMWRNNSSWINTGKTSNNSTNNWVENSSFTDISGRWTLSDNNSFAVWKGTTSTAWETASNWKSGSLPSSIDIVQIGTETFTNQPTISSSVNAKSLSFGSVKGATITLATGGSLTVNGNVRSDWAGDAAHTINAGNQNLTINGDLILSNGSATRYINLIINTGSVYVAGSLTQSGASAITFKGAGSLRIDNGFDNTGGTFTAGKGTVIYGGSTSQTIGDAITYNNLSFVKTSGTATFSSSVKVNGDLTLSNGGVFNLKAPLTVLGNVIINSGVTVNEGSDISTIGGNWMNNGVYNSYLGTVKFNGALSQSISSTTFYNLAIAKTSETISLAGDITINGNLTLTSGTLDLGSYNASRSVAGGTLTVSAGASLRVGGASNFPGNFNVKTISATSSVEYYGTMQQTVLPLTYGNLTLSNGSSAKKLISSTTVAGDFSINTNASLSADSCTLSLLGNFNNSGNLIPGTGTVALKGTAMVLNGATTFNNLIISGSYTSTAGSNLIVNGYVNLSGSLNSGSNSTILNGDLTISGTSINDGNTIYTGTRLQTIRLTGIFQSPAFTNTTTFNGNVAPILNSTATPAFINVNINNTSAEGIRASVGWKVYGRFTVAAQCKFNGGSLTHTFYGPFTNNGTVVSSGYLKFNPTPPFINVPAIPVQLGSGTSFTSTGTVEFSGSQQIVLTSAPSSFQRVIVSNTNAAGITPPNSWSINGDFTINSGSTFNAGTGLIHTLRSNLSVAGTFSGGTSTISMNPLDSADYISASGSLTFNNLTISGNIAALSDFTISGNFTDNGTFDSDNTHITFNGAANSIIGGTASSIPFTNLIINKQGATVSLSKGISGIEQLSVLSGTFYDKGKSISEDAVLGGSLSVSSGATFKIDSVNTVPVFSNGYTFNPASTVEYMGLVQLVSSQNYGNLTLRNGAKTFVPGTTKVSTFTNYASAKLPDNSILQVSGNWINNGLFIYQQNTVEFRGSSTQTISGTSVTDFNNITVTNTVNPGVLVESNQRLKGVLTLASNVTFDADGSGDQAVFTLVSSADNPTIDASIAALPSGASVIGKVTAQRYMSLEGTNNSIYRYISSPVQNATVADIQNEIPITGAFTGHSVCSICTSNPSMYMYDETVVTDLNKDKKIDMNDGYIKYPVLANTETLATGKGYSLYVRGTILSSALWDVRGVINSGQISFPISYTPSTNPAGDGWNLIGNPYPSTIDWNSPSWIKTNVDAVIYITDNAGATSQYATWNGVVGTNGGSQYIAAGQGFWVKATGSSPVLKAVEDVKTAGKQTVFFRKKNPENLVRITLTNGSQKDDAVIHFREDATDGVDKNADAFKLTGGTFNLSSSMNDGTKLAINSLGSFNCLSVVKLSVDDVKPGHYSLDFSEWETFSSPVNITLVDKWKGEAFNVKSRMSYSFDVSEDLATFGNKRFELVFSDKPVVSGFSPATSPALCEGVDARIKITNAQSGVEYTGMLDEKIIATGSSDSSTVSLVVPKTLLVAGENIITVSPSVPSCSYGLSKLVVVTVETTSIAKVIGGNICREGTVQLEAHSLATTGSYKWYESDSALTAVAGQTGSTFYTPTLSSSRSYYVSFVNELGCEGVRVPVEATVQHYPDAIITREGNILHSNFTSGNQWYFNDAPLAEGQQSMIKLESVGNYSLSVNVAGCTTMAALSVTDEKGDALVKAYPNPVVDKLTIVAPGPVESYSIVRLLTLSGQEITSARLESDGQNAAGEIDMKNYTAGVYLVEVSNQQKTVTVKVVKKP